VEQYSTQNIFKVPISDDGTEYYYLEYRNPDHPGWHDHFDSDFSAYNSWFTPGSNPLDKGLLVWQVDETVPVNPGTPAYPNYGVRVIDAGYDPAHPWDGTEFTEWWYPYEFRIGACYSPDDPGQTTLSPTTSPSSDGYDGPSGITISVVSMNDDYITIEIDKPMAPEFDPVTPVTLEAQSSLEVSVTSTDPNCTTPTLSPVSLPSYASFTDQGSGQGTLYLDPVTGEEGIDHAILMASDGSLDNTIDIEITVTEASCLCPCHSDPQCDGNPDVLDVVQTVNVAFRNQLAVADPVCPYDQTDVNCSGDTDVLDVVRVVNVAFRNADPAGEFCEPCAP
jgi:hypothetical protein